MIEIFLAALATYRITRMIIGEYGPFHIFEKLRLWAANYQWLDEGLSCPLCLSFWVSLPITTLAIVFWKYTIIKIILTWLGIAGLNVIIFRKVES